MEANDSCIFLSKRIDSKRNHYDYLYNCHSTCQCFSTFFDVQITCDLLRCKVRIIKKKSTNAKNHFINIKSFHKNDNRKVGNMRSTGWESGVYKSLRYAWREAKRKTQKCKSAFMHGHLPKFDHCFVIRWIYIPVDYVHQSQFVIYQTKRSKIGEERFDMSAATRLENYCAKYYGINASSSPFPHVAIAI